MQNEVYYALLETHIVCINIKPEFWHALSFLFPFADISQTLSFLLHKHKSALLRISISREKKTATTTYQPRTGGYQRRTLRISPSLWKLFKELKEHTGYSISAIIRIIIEWELEERLGQQPTWKFKERNYRDNENPYLPCNSYIIFRVWTDRGNLKELYSYYWDDS